MKGGTPPLQNVRIYEFSCLESERFLFVFLEFGSILVTFAKYILECLEGMTCCCSVLLTDLREQMLASAAHW